MRIVITTCLVLLTSSVQAEEQQRVYQTDAYGRIRYNKPSYSVGGRRADRGGPSSPAVR
jgi:hypothetical protein